MNNPAAHDAPGRLLIANGALLILAGLVGGLGVDLAPYPRLMLTAHIQLLVNGMLSMLAGLMVRTSASTVDRRGAAVVVWAHVSAWAVCTSEVAAWVVLVAGMVRRPRA